jgi:predicted ATPase
MAVFVGGSTIAAASAVFPCPESSSTLWLLDRLGSLVDKSLLRCQDGPNEEPRFGMLQVIREFLLEQLEAHGEAAAARERHARHFLAMLESSGPVLLPALDELGARQRGPAADPGRHLRLALEQNNLRAALRWLVECG